MKAIINTVFGGLLPWKVKRNKINAYRDQATEKPPLRAELFSAEQMERHGITLAASHRLSTQTFADKLLTRLSENEAVLVECARVLTQSIAANNRISPAGEWLLDNFYLIDEQIRTAKRHLPKGYSRELPRLSNSPSIGLPRVYDIALEAVAHGDGRIDPEGLSRFVTAYQTVTPLKLGELWAIPIMLRLALIENLRRISIRIAAGKIDQDLADSWASQMIEIAEQEPKSLILVVADMARSKPPMTTQFVSEFSRHLQGQGSALALPLTWIEQLLAESNLTIEQLVQMENQQQAADQVSIGNSIGSLRVLGAMDWQTFVESVSIVEQTLCQDPVDAYAKMDFATRDRYRHVVEKIAKYSKQSEQDIALLALQLAKDSLITEVHEQRCFHIGFYLIDQGLPALEQKAGMRLPMGQVLQKPIARFPLLCFLTAIALLTAGITSYLTMVAYVEGMRNGHLALLACLSVLAASQLAVALANWLVTLFATPHTLPRMDYSIEIPAQQRTLVVVPTLLTSTQNIEELIEALEVRFLANRDDSLHFGLLTDFLDAPEETSKADKPLVQLAVAGINQLNEKYPKAVGDTFFLFHRPRLWNPHDQVWMGYERKRGKLADLNALLLGGDTKHFSLIVGNVKILTDVKYVITLDTDTQLPRDAARQLVGAMAHPLNRACYDKQKHRVVDGYGILQPRVSASLAGLESTRYAQLYGGEQGIDPYTRAVSDVYQDVFHEGSFIGKGIYDVDAFECALKNCFPENRILSHDLLEGCYARSGLLSDVQLYEAYPRHYADDVSRRHRWIRGDWQLSGWLLPNVTGLDGRRQKNTLSGLSRWKLFDNLRRSLSAPAMTLILLAGWTVWPLPWFWTLSVIAILLVPVLSAALVNLIRKPSDLLLRQHLISEIHATGEGLIQVLLTLSFLPYEAYFSMDAISRTVWRMLVSHKRLLEWKPSSESNRNNRNDILTTFRLMWIAPLIVAGTGIALIALRPEVMVIAAPILWLWLVSPAIAWWISLPTAQREAKLTAGQCLFLRLVARKTWGYFETFVGPEDHWLPPDNFQEYRGVGVAHRTSPTNMGLGLLANLSAYDFGYIPNGILLERTNNTLGTMAGLEKYQGHFYNWYDTLTTQPLPPLYVSTVDSGNLAGHLLTLHQGFLELPDHPVLAAQCFDGLFDTLGVLINANGGMTPPLLTAFQTELEFAINNRPITLLKASRCLESLTISAEAYVNNIEDVAVEPKEWGHALARQCRAILNELQQITPWITLLTTPKGFEDYPELSAIPTLRELAAFDIGLLPAIDQQLTGNQTPEQRDWLNQLKPFIQEASRRANDRLKLIEALALQTDQLAKMEYGFLFDKPRRLLAIGFNVAERQRDSGFYDLLASEARLGIFVAIAQRQIPQESWFALGRLLVTSEGKATLLSWSGSMFEYLMPLLVMPTYENTLIDQTLKTVVQRQIDYGKQRGVAWGISESGFNTVDVQFNYQYRAFGVPGLGLKRGLAEDLVIAPYASVLGLMVAPEASCLNLQRLATEGLLGRFGFYEAVDYTPSRQRRGESNTVIQSYMAHHQGMSLLSLAYVLLNRPMQRRFSSNPLFQATMLLLQERIPKASAFYVQAAEVADVLKSSSEVESQIRVISNPNTALPEVQLLSNGRYHVMVTNSGGGYSRWKDLAVTRWREDSTCDHWGTFCYIRDMATGGYWSTAHQPTLKRSEHYEAIFSEGRAEFRRRDHEFDTHTDIVVSPEDDIEMRRIRITNRAQTTRTIESHQLFGSGYRLVCVG